MNRNNSVKDLISLTGNHCVINTVCTMMRVEAVTLCVGLLKPWTDTYKSSNRLYQTCHLFLVITITDDNLMATKLTQ